MTNNLDELRSASGVARQRMLETIDRFQRGEATLADMDAASLELSRLSKLIRQATKAASKRPRGRPPLPPDQRLVQRAIRMKPALWEKIDANGLDWLRDVIEQAPLKGEH